METCAYTRERKVDRREKKMAKSEMERRTREKKTRYTCLKERRDTHSTVTKHPSFGRAQKRIEGTKPMVEEKKRGGNTGTRFGAQMIAKKEEREEPNETSASVCVYVRIKDFSLSSSVSFFPALSFPKFPTIVCTYRREY